ncbi:MAG: hypothetical protein KAS15_06375 [Nanoarchaeota archaeon]|nr:hypothetical protein [Nanoarchaeota archaeon]
MTNMGDTPYKLEGRIKSIPGREFKFTQIVMHKSNDILEKYEGKQKFERVYLGEVQVSEYAQYHSEQPYEDGPEIIQQIIREHLEVSTLMKIAKKHYVNLKVDKSTSYEGASMFFCNLEATHSEALFLEILACSPKEVDSIFNATKEYENLIKTELYQNITKITKKFQGNIQKHLNEIVDLFL